MISTCRRIAPVLACVLAVVAPSRAPARLTDATANRNQTSAGTLRHGVLSVSLVVQMADWHPLADDGPAVPVEAYAEEGRAPSVPGPLLRAPLGTRIELSLRNALADTAFYSIGCSYPCRTPDTLRVAPGRVGRLSFTPRGAGTFVYWGGIVRRGAVIPGGTGGQLLGVVVVDSGRATPDRILALTTFESDADSAHPTARFRLVMAINGKAWPYTERITQTVGDSVHWRIVHLGGGEHPMHLHGFYFRVESHGDGQTDTPIASNAQPLGVTEEVGTLGTMRISWSPDRAGNWLFHCHKPFHAAVARSDDAYEKAPVRDHHAAGDHAMTGMGGLVLGITVKPASSVTLAGQRADAAVNRMRLLVHRRDHYWGAEPAYGFVLQRGPAPARDSVLVPGPILTLTRGERAEIAVVNETDASTSVHWHGIELESYFDGVSGWSGAGARTAPRIAPNDSFVATFTPPRAGTFIYHTHMDDLRQLAGGLYGGLVVLEPGQRWNDTTDHLFAIGQAGLDEPAWTVVNGLPTSRSLRWRKGVTHRLRFLSVTLDEESDVVIEREGGGVVTWTPVARDGAPLPPTLVAPQPAKLHIGPGQTNDFEFSPEPGRYHMRISALTNVLLTIVVR